MDNSSNGEYKRPKRPRIGSTNAGGPSSADSRFEKVSYGPDSESNNGSSYSHQQRPYNPRPRYNGGNYGNRDQQGGYQRRDYQQQDGGYQPRPRNNYNNGYNNNNYNNGYQRPQSGYQRPNYDRSEGQESSYRPRYNPNNGYNNRDRDQQQGGYQPQGGYERQGGYQPRPRNNNYGNRDQQQGGYRQNGFKPRNNNNNGNRYNKPQGPRQQAPRPGKSFTPRPKRVFYEEPEVDPNSEIRLNKFIANSGICSRREADEFIQKGEIKVNGQVVTELGTKITPKDVVEYNDKVVTTERKCYVLLNKPKDCVTTADDPNGRLTVMDLVKNACEERIYPVGRLDRNTTGVLLLTNDGDLASKLTHPQYVKKKIYHVWTDKDIEEDDMQRIADGIELEDGPIHADAISYATETDRNQAGIEIHSGRNRIVRRIFESLGYHVTKLDRVYFAGLTKKNLPRGRWRYLTQEEVNFLKMGSFD